MRNFLQRIASTVTPGATPRLHPMLGSIFAPLTPLHHLEAPPTTAMAPAFTEQSSPRPQLHAQNASALHFGEPPLLDPAPTRAAAATFSATGHERRSEDGDAPLLPQQDLSPSQRIAPFPLSQPPEATAPHAAYRDAVTESPQRLLKHGDATGAAMPPPASQRLQPLIGTVPRPRMAAARPPLERPLRQAAREPDEIHIHIGCIEVAAVAQPVPRPPPAPARKSFSLEEYLRRGNGRQG